MKKIIAVLASILISACTQSEDPKIIAQQYWLAMQAGDYAKARTMVAANSLVDFDEYTSMPDIHKSSLDAVTLLDSHTTVATVINSGNSSAHFDTVLVMQEGKWYIDAAATNIPPPRTALEQRLDDMAEQLSDVMDSSAAQLEEGMDMLNDLLHSGSQELNDSVGNSIDRLNESILEAMRKLEERRQQPVPSEEPI